MTVEMVIKRLYFATAKKRGNCTFRFEKLYVSFSRLYSQSILADINNFHKTIFRAGAAYSKICEGVSALGGSHVTSGSLANQRSCCLA